MPPPMSATISVSLHCSHETYFTQTVLVSSCVPHYHACTHTHTHTQSYSHTHTHNHIHTHTHTRTRTHILAELLSDVVGTSPQVALDSVPQLREAFSYLALLPPSPALELLQAILVRSIRASCIFWQISDCVCWKRIWDGGREGGRKREGGRREDGRVEEGSGA